MDTLVYTSSRQQANLLAIARVAAAGRITAERKAQAADHQRDLDSGSTEDYCFICKRVTDHRGEHSDAQIAAWQQGQPWVLS